MKIINKTKCPISLLTRLVNLAAKAIGVQADEVKITQGRTAGIRGWASHQLGICTIRISLPRLEYYDALTLAEDWFGVLLHEFGHILDYKDETKQFVYYSNAHSKRKLKHGIRPQEIRADQYAKAAQAELCNNSVYSDLIIELAEYLQG